jgi:NAD(P)-dependent dehydrogenase (short-subunit alcohol dehydrogenase family)
MSLQRKTALITGGSSAIGLTTARLFAAEGIVRRSK